MILKNYPKISIITPNFNGGKFLEDTILSVLNQNYPNLEYIIIDGGSTDNSLDIIYKYSSHLKYWVSESDDGLYDALQKGFNHSSGEIMGWLNSDDLYTNYTFSIIGEIFDNFHELEWLTSNNGITWDLNGRPVNIDYRHGFNKEAFNKGYHLTGGSWYSTHFIQQEATFWRRSLWERSGSRLRTDFKLAADFELWLNFYEHAELFSVTTILGGMRSHNTQLSVLNFDKYLNEAICAMNNKGLMPQNNIESKLRKVFSIFFKRTFIPITYLPNILYSFLINQKIFFKSRRLSWRNNKWEINEGIIL